MLLRELLPDLCAPLLEDLGNLKFVKKEFRSVLKVGAKKRVPQDSEHGYRDVTAYSGHSKLGQGSKIDNVPFKSAGQVGTELEKPEVKGVVISSGTTQLMIAVQVNVKAKVGFDTTYTIGIDLKALDEVMGSGIEPETLAKFWKIIVERAAVSKVPLTPGDTRLGPYIMRHCTKSELSISGSTILKALKGKKLPAELHVIKVDEERQAIKVKRAAGRRGVVPRLTDDTFEKQAKAELRMRLDRFKSSKAVGVDKLEELIDAIREKGYLDKIKIGGFAYDLKNENIRMSDLKKPTKWSKSYIEYQINSSTHEYEAYEEQRRQARRAGDEAFEAFMKVGPRRTVKIILKLEKGSIVPGEIETED